MKKIYLSLGVALIASSAISQVSVNKLMFAPKKFDNSNVEQSIIKPAIGNEKAGGVEIWGDDFTTTSNWIADNDGQSGANFGWNMNSTSQAWFSSFQGAMQSTSGGNCAEVQNGTYNPSTQATGVVYTLTTAAAIDVDNLSSGSNQVSLQFEQWGALFNDAQTVHISTDGNVWTEVFTNDGRDAFIGNNPSAIYGNTETITVNITSEIAADPTNVFIRFQWSSLFPNETDPVAWTTFGWYIDDVKIITNPDNDVTLDAAHFSQGAFNFPYYIIAQSQVGDINFSANITNNGATDQANTVLTATAGGGTYTSAPITLTAGSSDSVFTTTNYNPGTTVGAQTFDFDLQSANTDDNPGDNSASATINISEFVFARDMAGLNGTATTGSITNWASAAGEQFKIGNIFEIQADVTMYAVDIKFSGSVPTGGGLVYGEVYKFNSGTQTYDFVESTVELDIQTASQITNKQTLLLNSPIDFVAGDDILLVAGHYGSDIGIAYSGNAVDNSVLGFDAAGSLVGLLNPVNVCVRMNFDLSVGVEEETADFTLRQNIPNPFTGSTEIIFDLVNTQEVFLTITDMTGKVIETRTLGNLPVGNHRVTVDGSSYASGVYYYTLSAGNSTTTKKMVVR